MVTPRCAIVTMLTVIVNVHTSVPAKQKSLELHVAEELGYRSLVRPGSCDSGLGWPQPQKCVILLSTCCCFTFKGDKKGIELEQKNAFRISILSLIDRGIRRKRKVSGGLLDTKLEFRTWLPVTSPAICMYKLNFLHMFLNEEGRGYFVRCP